VTTGGKMEKDVADQQEPCIERQKGSETTWPVLGSAKNLREEGLRYVGTIL